MFRFNIPTVAVNVSIEKPSFVISSDEHKLNLPQGGTVLADALKQKLLEAGFPVIQNSSTADYRITITTDLQNLGKTENYHQAALRVQIVVSNAAGSEVFRYSNERIRGTQFEASVARVGVLQEARRLIELTVAGNLIERVVKGN